MITSHIDYDNEGGGRVVGGGREWDEREGGGSCVDDAKKGEPKVQCSSLEGGEGGGRGRKGGGCSNRGGGKGGRKERTGDGEEIEGARGKSCS